ncbi:MAG: signal recognition particle subunit SRP19/SEC65 family protein [Candidatus Lokiarchaeota archaeon]|nr:signal recognition particle subunit SRP19/SEC65 family protein [Candidatus Lokiarchaeota archaeon]
MRSRLPYHIYWPQYFEIKRSRSEGRRVPKKFASDKINLELLAKAARRLGYTAEIEKNYQYPKTWWDDPGRVLIDTKGKKKSKVLIEVAKEIAKMRTK